MAGDIQTVSWNKQHNTQINKTNLNENNTATITLLPAISITLQDIDVLDTSLQVRNKINANNDEIESLVTKINTGITKINTIINYMNEKVPFFVNLNSKINKGIDYTNEINQILIGLEGKINMVIDYGGTETTSVNSYGSPCWPGCWLK